MRRLAPALVIGTLVAASGFAAASIASGSSLTDLSTAGTTEALPITGSLPTSGPVTICHHTGSKKHASHTITVNAHALPAHLAHGDTLGACAPAVTGTTSTSTTGEGSGKKGHEKGGDSPPPPGITTTTAPASTTSGSDPGKGEGNDGDDQRGGQGDGNGNGHGNGHH